MSHMRQVVFVRHDLRDFLAVDERQRWEEAQFQRQAREDSLRVMMTATSNQVLERTADRRENLLSMTSIVKLEAQRAVVSGRSARSR